MLDAEDTTNYPAMETDLDAVIGDLDSIHAPQSVIGVFHDWLDANKLEDEGAQTGSVAESGEAVDEIDQVEVRAKPALNTLARFCGVSPAAFGA